MGSGPVLPTSHEPGGGAAWSRDDHCRRRLRRGRRRGQAGREGVPQPGEAQQLLPRRRRQPRRHGPGGRRQERPDQRHEGPAPPGQPHPHPGPAALHQHVRVRHAIAAAAAAGREAAQAAHALHVEGAGGVDERPAREGDLARVGPGRRRGGAPRQLAPAAGAGCGVGHERVHEGVVGEGLPAAAAGEGGDRGEGSVVAARAAAGLVKGRPVGVDQARMGRPDSLWPGRR